MWKDLKNKIIAGLIMLCIGQALALFGQHFYMKGTLDMLREDVKRIERTIDSIADASSGR